MIWNFVNSMPQVYRGSPLVRAFEGLTRSYLVICAPRMHSYKHQRPVIDSACIPTYQISGLCKIQLITLVMSNFSKQHC